MSFVYKMASNKTLISWHILCKHKTNKNWNVWQFLEVKWRIDASVIEPSLVQIMACRVVDAKSLSEPMLEHC